MNVFSKFEGKMDDFMDGAAGSLFKSPIEPSQIAKKCEKQMHRNKLVGAGLQHAPTLYTVLVNPEDDDRLYGFYPTMAGELETYLVGKANEADLELSSRPLVRFIVDDRLKRGKFDVIAEVVDARTIDDLRQEEAEYYGIDLQSQRQEPRRQEPVRRQEQRPLPRQEFEPIAPVVAPVAIPAIDPEPSPYERSARPQADQYGFQPCVLVNLRTGDTYPLDHEIVTLGRYDTCDITLQDSSVSRNHARFERDAMGNWRVYDLDSANGTLVNNISVVSSDLRYGDQITFGTTILQFRKG